MVATVVQLISRGVAASVPAEQPQIVRDMAMQLIADRIDLSDDENPDIVMSLHAAGWRWRSIKPHIDDAIQEAKQIILMREMGLEPCQK